jgi:hypothetical protein
MLNANRFFYAGVSAKRVLAVGGRIASDDRDSERWGRAARSARQCFEAATTTKL